MRRRSVMLTIEVETVMTIGELKKLREIRFEYSPGKSVLLSSDPEAEKECGPCLGTIRQVQVNVVKPKKKTAKK